MDLLRSSPPQRSRPVIGSVKLDRQQVKAALRDHRFKIPRGETILCLSCHHPSVLLFCMSLSLPIITMTKSQPRSGDNLPAEDYELQETSPPEEPLLPRYNGNKPSTDPSPHHRHELAKRHSAFRRAISCLCLALVVVVPSLALAACYFGRTTLDRVRSWEQLPDEVKAWLDKAVPYKAVPDHGAFPTK